MFYIKEFKTTSTLMNLLYLNIWFREQSCLFWKLVYTKNEHCLYQKRTLFIALTNNNKVLCIDLSRFAEY